MTSESLFPLLSSGDGGPGQPGTPEPILFFGMFLGELWFTAVLVTHGSSIPTAIAASTAAGAAAVGVARKFVQINGETRGGED